MVNVWNETAAGNTTPDGLHIQVSFLIALRGGSRPHRGRFHHRRTAVVRLRGQRRTPGPVASSATGFPSVLSKGASNGSLWPHVP
jgi:hypothetical protein